MDRLRVARTEKRVTTWETWLFRAALVLGAILLFHSTRRLLGETRLWHVGFDGAYALAGITLLGILFAWWARLHLGRLWSSAITRKEDHRVIETGPLCPGPSSDLHRIDTRPFSPPRQRKRQSTVLALARRSSLLACGSRRGSRNAF